MCVPRVGVGAETVCHGLRLGLGFEAGTGAGARADVGEGIRAGAGARAVAGEVVWPGAEAVASVVPRGGYNESQ